MMAVPEIPTVRLLLRSWKGTYQSLKIYRDHLSAVGTYIVIRIKHLRETPFALRL